MLDIRVDLWLNLPMPHTHNDSAPLEAAEASSSGAAASASNMPDIAVICFDAGGQKGLGWWATPHGTLKQNHGVGVASLPDALSWIAEQVQLLPVAIGIEAPCWLPMAHDGRGMLKARPFEGTAWSGAGGLPVATQGAALMAEVTRSLSRLNVRYTFDVPTAPGEVCLWEAYVSEAYKPGKLSAAATPQLHSNPHIADAQFAVEHGFLPLYHAKRLSPPLPFPLTRDVVSLLGNAVAQEAHDGSLVAHPCMVIGPGTTPGPKRLFP